MHEGNFVSSIFVLVVLMDGHDSGLRLERAFSAISVEQCVLFSSCSFKESTLVIDIDEDPMPVL